MGNLIDRRSQSSANIMETVRYLATRPGIGPGSKVLVCGITSAELIQGLTDLGLLVTCTSESSSETESLQATIPEADCCEGNGPREQFDLSDAGFNLVVVPAPSRDECPSVYARPHLMELASRLACLHPGGYLVQLGGSDSDAGLDATHPVKCCLRQVSIFPGRNSIHSFGGSIRLRYARRSSQFAICLQIPEQRMSPFEWDVLALNASKRLPVDCCQESAGRDNSDLEQAA